MAKKGTNLRVVQEAMGHKHLKTSSLYVSLAREQMNKEMQEKSYVSYNEQIASQKLCLLSGLFIQSKNLLLYFIWEWEVLF